MLCSVESEGNPAISEGNPITEANEATVRPVGKKVGRPSNAEKIATVSAQLAAGNLTQAEVSAMLPPKQAKLVRELCKVSKEEFAVLMRSKWEELATLTADQAKEQVSALKGINAFVAFGITSDKLAQFAPNAGITHQVNVQINGVDADSAAKIAGRFATKNVAKGSQVNHDKNSHEGLLPVFPPQMAAPSVRAETFIDLPPAA
jgi:hypothetical protein